MYGWYVGRDYLKTMQWLSNKTRAEVGIYKRKQESKKTRKHASEQESNKEKKRKHALDQEKTITAKKKKKENTL